MARFRNGLSSDKLFIMLSRSIQATNASLKLSLNHSEKCLQLSSRLISPCSSLRTQYAHSEYNCRYYTRILWGTAITAPPASHRSTVQEKARVEDEWGGKPVPVANEVVAALLPHAEPNPFWSGPFCSTQCWFGCLTLLLLLCAVAAAVTADDDCVMWLF